MEIQVRILAGEPSGAERSRVEPSGADADGTAPIPNHHLGFGSLSHDHFGKYNQFATRSPELLIRALHNLMERKFRFNVFEEGKD